MHKILLAHFVEYKNLIYEVWVVYKEKDIMNYLVMVVELNERVTAKICILHLRAKLFILK